MLAAHLSLRATRTQQADTKAANMSFSALKAATVHAGLLLSASLEKKNTFMCKMDYFMTMADIGFKM